MEKRFLCHICGKQYSHQHYLTHHIRVHEGYRFICRIDMCNTFFTTNRSLKEHQLIHSGERPYICHICGKTFRCKSDFYQHCKIHDMIRPSYVCEVCQRGYVQKNGLRQHSNRTHWKDRLKIWQG